MMRDEELLFHGNRNAREILFLVIPANLVRLSIPVTITLVSYVDLAWLISIWQDLAKLQPSARGVIEIQLAHPGHYCPGHER